MDTCYITSVICPHSGGRCTHIKYQHIKLKLIKYCSLSVMHMRLRPSDSNIGQNWKPYSFRLTPKGTDESLR
jgi:hypothetical protein